MLRKRTINSINKKFKEKTAHLNTKQRQKVAKEVKPIVEALMNSAIDAHIRNRTPTDKTALSRLSTECNKLFDNQIKAVSPKGRPQNNSAGIGSSVQTGLEVFEFGLGALKFAGDIIFGIGKLMS